MASKFGTTTTSKLAKIMGHTSGVAGLGTTTFVSGNYEKKMGHLAGISSVGIYLCMICVFFC